MIEIPAFYFWDSDEGKEVPFDKDIDLDFIVQTAEKVGGTLMGEVIGLGRDAYEIRIDLGPLRLYPSLRHFLYFRCLDGWDQGGWAVGFGYSGHVVFQGSHPVEERVNPLQEAYRLFIEQWADEVKETTTLLERLQGGLP